MKPNEGKNALHYDENMRLVAGDHTGLIWLSPTEEPFRISGFAWLGEDQVYRRLPVAPKWRLPEAVDYLANHTAGGQIRFTTDSPKLTVKVRLAGAADMYHMPSTGQCGFDCYIGEPGEQQYCSTVAYDHRQTEYEHTLYAFESREKRCITLNFPLYQGVKEVLVGLEPGSLIGPPPAYDDNKKVIIYGTSITQGGCANRPGMAYPNIMSRRINREFINLGFSGNGKGEPELARIIGEIADPACLVLDYEANCVSKELFAETLPEFIRIYRERHPLVPIIVVSKVSFAQELWNKAQATLHEERKQLQRSVVEQAREAGDRNIHFVDGSAFLGQFGQEATVDGVHPTDLGFLEMANHFTPILREILATS